MGIAMRDAKSGLSLQMSRYHDREMLFSSSSFLLPDFLHSYEEERKKKGRRSNTKKIPKTALLWTCI
jgi:hypothetical protein